MIYHLIKNITYKTKREQRHYKMYPIDWTRKKSMPSIGYTLILEAYRFKNRNKGARLIKMTLEKYFNTVMNLKKIRRLMKKFNLVCPIRKAKS